MRTTHAILAELQYHIHILIVLEAVVEAHNMRMREHLVQLDLRPQLHPNQTILISPKSPHNRAALLPPPSSS